MSKILIIDKSVDLLETLSFILVNKKYVVKTLNVVDHIYEEISSFDPDLLILSIFLPGIDGRDVCKKLRNDVSTKYLCVLLTSTFTEELINYKSHGADDYLEKPFDLDTFEKKITSLLEWAPIRKKAFSPIMQHS